MVITLRGKWVAAGGAAIFAAGAVHAGTILHVDDSAPPGGDGLSWQTAYRFLADAMITAASGGVDEVRVGQGVYLPDRDELHPSGTGDVTASFDFLAAFALKGGFAGFGAPDPDARDPDAFLTTLSGDIDGDGVLDEDNSRHVLTAIFTLGQIIVDGLTVTGGRALDFSLFFSRGGGLRCQNGNMQLSRCRFLGNLARHGGAIFFGGGTLHLDDCQVSGNTGAETGGGLVLGAGSNITIEDCDISDAIAGSGSAQGGGIYMQLCTVAISNTTFTGNAFGYGGAIYTDHSTLTLIGCTLDDNTAFSSGGGVYTAFSSVALTGCQVQGNFAFQSGGAVADQSASTITASGSTFSFNHALSIGGAIAGATVIATDCTFEGNLGNERGGAIHLAQGAMTRCSFLSNQSFIYGGGVTIEGAPLHLVSLTDCTFEGNSGGTGGGGVYVLGQNLATTVFGCVFRGNQASFGGAIRASPPLPAALVVHDSVIQGNVASIGGGVFVDHTALQMVNCALTGNQASFSDGGALQIEHGDATVLDCTINANSAPQGVGGGIRQVSDGSTALSIANSIVWDNSDAAGTVESSQLNVAAGTAVNYCDVMNLTGALGGVGNIGADPLFVDADGADSQPGTGDDDLRLQAGSPCIDAADNDAVPPGVVTDLAGMPRFLEIPESPDTGNGALPIVDMGAYESLGGGCLAVLGQEVICHAGGSAFTVNVVGLNACTGATTSASFTASGGAPGEDLCATVVIADQGGFCCTTLLCIPVPECPPPGNASDLDGDGVVGVSDLLALLDAWGGCGGCAADFDGDGLVGVADLLQLLADWSL